MDGMSLKRGQKEMLLKSANKRIRLVKPVGETYADVYAPDQYGNFQHIGRITALDILRILED